VGLRGRGWNFFAFIPIRSDKIKTRKEGLSPFPPFFDAGFGVSVEGVKSGTVSVRTRPLIVLADQSSYHRMRKNFFLSICVYDRTWHVVVTAFVAA